jgi:hypothetical protein
MWPNDWHAIGGPASGVGFSFDSWRRAVPRRDVALRRVAIALCVAVWAGSFFESAEAGGGPENVLLLVNLNSESSKTVANHYIALRQIPANNVLYVDWKGNLEICSGKNFRDLILKPALAAIVERRLAAQIDYIVYSSDFPWRVELKPLFPDENFPEAFPPIASVTGATYLAAYLVGEEPAPGIVMPTTNWYVPRSQEGNLIKCQDLGVLPSRAFRNRYEWGPQGGRVPPEERGQRYFLSASLGITQGRGNTIEEVISYLTRAKAADGTRPRGTVYFMRNGDIRSAVRHSCYASAAAAIQAAGVQARVLDGKIPTKAKDVMGIMAGAEFLDLAGAQNLILPGAICEHLTSGGGQMHNKGYHTPLSEFLRAGAAGASGAVTEPRALQAKFPLPSLHLHYVRGCSLAESFFQSVMGPYQLLIVGDPLCQPWALPPKVTVDGIRPDQEVSGEVQLSPGGLAAPSRRLGFFDLLIDGRLISRTTAGQKQNLSINAAELSDGYHELRMIGTNADAVETQGRIVVPFQVNRGAPEIELEVRPAGDVSRSTKLRVRAKQPTATSIVIRQNSREVGRIEGSEGEVEIEAAGLGRGPTTLQAVSEGPAPAASQPVALAVR